MKKKVRLEKSPEKKKGKEGTGREVCSWSNPNNPDRKKRLKTQNRVGGGAIEQMDGRGAGGKKRAGREITSTKKRTHREEGKGGATVHMGPTGTGMEEGE